MIVVNDMCVNLLPCINSLVIVLMASTRWRQSASEDLDARPCAEKEFYARRCWKESGAEKRTIPYHKI